MSDGWLQVFAVVRMTALIPLVALLIYALIRPDHSDFRPLVKSLIFYFGLTLVNTYIRYYIDEMTSRYIIAVLGTLALMGVVAGVVASVRSGGN